MGTSATVPGICNGIQTFFAKRGLANSEMVLTWDSGDKRSKARRDAACGSKYCSDFQKTLVRDFGNRNIKVSCDEFPFASTEEGGSYLGTNPVVTQRTCVPAWQQNLQGNCNSELSGRCQLNRYRGANNTISGMLSQVETNVAYFERKARGDNVENFVDWRANFWTKVGGIFNGQPIPPQRLARYPNEIPQAAGVSDNVCISSIHLISCSCSVSGTETCTIGLHVRRQRSRLHVQEKLHCRTRITNGPQRWGSLGTWYQPCHFMGIERWDVPCRHRRWRPHSNRLCCEYFRAARHFPRTV